MKAELDSGEIVDLEHDCACQTHDGPHFLHMSDMERRLNARMLEPNRSLSQGQAALLTERFREAELTRLNARLAWMEERGIRKIVRTQVTK